MYLRLLIVCCLCTGCASVPFGWSPRSTGCVERGVFEIVQSPELAALNPMDVRVAKLEGESAALSTVIEFRRQFGGIGISEGAPEILFSVGDFKERTCSRLTTAADCPAGESFYKLITAVSLPLDFRFGAPQTLTHMHGPTYYLVARDGLGNSVTWSFYGSPSHPLKDAIDLAVGELQQCYSGAVTDYREAF